MRFATRNPEPDLWFAECDGVSVGFHRSPGNSRQLFLSISTEEATQDSYADGTPRIWIGLNDVVLYDGEDYVQGVDVDVPEPEERQILREQKGECARLGNHFFKRDFIFGVIPLGPPYCMWCGKENDE